jgi:hypothetical protein
MRSLQKSGVAIRTEISVFDSANVAVTGLVNGDFTKLLSKDGANSVIAVTVTEIASGRYTVTFTPDSAGFWYLDIRHSTHKPRGWTEAFDVTTDGTLSKNDVGDGVLDQANGIETGYTFRQMMRVLSSILLGKASGGPGGSVFRDVNDTKNRITTVADSDGNRTTMTLDPN